MGKQVFQFCKYRPGGATCYDQKCDKCGWNPKVEDKRKEQIKMSLNVPSEKE